MNARHLFVLALILGGFGLLGRALGQGADPVQTELDAAKAAHTQAVNKANSALSAAFDAQIKSLGGDADSTKVLSTQKAAFIGSGAMPQSPLMKDAVATYKVSVKAADDKLADAYMKAIEGFNKENKIDLGAQARKDRTDLLGGPLAPPAGAPGSTPTAASIAAELDASKTTYRQSVAKAKDEFVKVVDGRISAATTAGDFTKVQALQSAKSTAEVDGSIPDDFDDAAVVAAKKRFDQAVIAANKTLALAYQKAIRDYTRTKSMPEAQTIQKEYNATGLNTDEPAGASIHFSPLGAKLPAYFLADNGFIGDKIGLHFDGRHFIRTKKADYLDHDFLFDLVFDIKKGDSIAFVGIGEGTPGGGEAANSVFLRMHAPDLGEGLIALGRGPSGGFTLGHHQAGGTYLARMEKKGKSMTFSVDAEWNGKEFHPMYKQTIDDIGDYAKEFDKTNTHLFFGGGGHFRQFRLVEHSLDAAEVVTGGDSPQTKIVVLPSDNGGGAESALPDRVDNGGAGVVPAPAAQPSPQSPNQSLFSFALIASAIKDNKVERTATIGGKGGGAFEDAPADGAILIGLIATHKKLGAGTVMAMIQPIYRTAEGRVDGDSRGKGGANKTTFIAKPGYAVGGLMARGAIRLSGMQIIFMRIKPDNSGLDPKDSYMSDWFGGNGGDTADKIGGDGKFIVGIFGATGADFDRFGLVKMP